MRFGKKGADMGLIVVLLIIAVIILVFYGWWIPKSLGKGAKVADEQLDEANKTKIKWSDLTDFQQEDVKKKGGAQAEKLMLEDAKDALQKGIHNKDKNELEKARKIAGDILDLNELSNPGRDEAQKIINDADIMLKSLKGKEKLKGLELTGGDKAGYSSVVSENPGTVLAAEARKKIFLLDGKNKADITQYRSAEIQSAGSDVNKVAEIEYTTGLLHEQFADLDSALKTYDSIYKKFGEELDIPEFAANALLRKAEILRNQRKGSESYDAYELLWRKYSDKSFNKKEDVQSSFKALMEAGLGKKISVKLRVDGSLQDDAWFEGNRKFVQFKGIKPQEEEYLENVASGGDFAANFIVRSGSYLEAMHDIGGGDVEGIAVDKPVNIYVSVFDTIFGEQLCNTLYKRSPGPESESCNKYIVIKRIEVYNPASDNNDAKLVLIGEIPYLKK